MWEHHPGENSAVGRQARSLRHQAFDDCRQPWKRIATFEYLIQFPFLGPKCVFIIITFLTSERDKLYSMLSQVFKSTLLA